MAKVVAEFDTKDKTCSVKIDGKPVDNCTDFSVMRYGKDYTMSLRTRMKDEENGMDHMYMVMATDSKEAQTAISKGEAFDFGHPDLCLVLAKSKTEEEISRLVCNSLRIKKV